MSDKSRIEWTDITWNFITGCTKISDGCLNCYIERTMPFRTTQRRFDKPGIGGASGVTLHPDRLLWPAKKWRKPSLIFVNSLADIFHEDVPEEFIARAFAVMAQTPQHTYQLLTKRHARMRSLLNSERFRVWTWAAQGDGQLGCTPVESRWPLPNVWLGVSVESQQWADIRIPALVETPAAVRWLSCEPLLGPVDLGRWIGGQCGCTTVRGERGISGGQGGRVGGRPTGARLESCGPTREWPDRDDPLDPMSPTESGAPGAQLLPSPRDVRLAQVQRDGAPTGLAALPWPDSRRPDREPQERHLDGQPPGKFGACDLCRTGCACTNDPVARAAEPIRGTQRHGEADIGTGRGDSRTQGNGRIPGVDRGGLPSAHAADIPNCTGRPSISWLVIGGESGPGARPMDLAWAESLVRQCRDAGVPAFVKQLGSRWGKQHHDIDLFPEALRVREYPEVSR